MAEKAKTLDSVLAALTAPFPLEEIDFRVSGQERDGVAPVVAYIDARVVQKRLDDVVGADGWSTRMTPYVNQNGVVCVVCDLTILGVTKSDIGAPSNSEGEKGAASDAEKRAAVQFGINREMYGFPRMRAAVTGRGYISDAEKNRLRKDVEKFRAGEYVASAPAAQKQAPNRAATQQSGGDLGPRPSVNQIPWLEKAGISFETMHFKEWKAALDAYFAESKASGKKPAAKKPLPKAEPEVDVYELDDLEAMFS